MFFKFINKIKIIHIISIILCLFSFKILYFGTDFAQALVLGALAAIVSVYVILTHKDERWQEQFEVKVKNLEDEYNIKIDAITKDLIQMNSRLIVVSNELNLRKETSEQFASKVYKRKF